MAVIFTDTDISVGPGKSHTTIQGKLRSRGTYILGAQLNHVFAEIVSSLSGARGSARREEWVPEEGRFLYAVGVVVWSTVGRPRVIGVVELVARCSAR